VALATRDTLTELVARPGPAHRSWALTALLGTTAKLLWALGFERDVLRPHAARVRDQRTLAGAISSSLDLIGADLGVPRFPPLPHGFDEDTIALYHLDDLDTDTADDFTGAFPGRTAHHGTISGAVRTGVSGRY